MKSKNLGYLAVSFVTCMLFACGSSPGGGSAGEIDAAAGQTDANVIGEPIGGDVFNESKIRTFSLTLPAQDWENLQATARDEVYTTATLQYDGETIENIGMRFKGNIGSLALCYNGDVLICDKLSMKLKFNEYVDGQRLHGLKRINLHAMMSDPSKMHDAIGYKLFRDIGVYAPRLAYARVVVNGLSLGLFAAVEAVDGRFTRANFPDGGKGNLYKEVWPEHLSETPYINALKTNRDPGVSADKMLRFAQEIQDVGDSGFVDTMRAWTDIDAYINYMAVARLVDHWDGIVAWYCGGTNCFNHNYYWYESSTEDKLWLVPWDLDHTFENPSPIRTAFGMPDWDDVDASCTPIPIFLNVSGRAPACDPIIGRTAKFLWGDYAAASQVLLGGAFSESALNARIDELATLIADEIEADTVSTQTSQDWRNRVEELKTAAAVNRAYIQGKL